MSIIFMFDLTREEKLVLIFLAVIFLTGASLHHAFKVNPHLADMVNVVDSERLFAPLDINKVTYEELLRIPHIGPVTAGRIIAYRRQYGPFADGNQLKSIRGIGVSKHQKISRYLKVY